MGATVSFHVQSVGWNSSTYNSTAGGPIMGQYQITGRELPDWTGDDTFNQFLAIVDQSARVIVRLREVKFLTPLGTKSNLVLTLKTKAGTVVITLANMVLADVRGSQSRSSPGDCELVFAHESADGTTYPAS